jgi:hypothetical protein
MSNAGQSNVGFPSLYEAQNQRNYKQSEVDDLTQHTGENVKGFLPSMSRRRNPSNPTSGRHANQLNQI